MVEALRRQGAPDPQSPDLARSPRSTASFANDAALQGLTERRRHARRPVLLVMTMPRDGAVTEIVCTDVSASGAYFASRCQPRPHEIVKMHVCSTYTGGRVVTLCGRVVHAMSLGGARPAGFAVAWQWALSAQSPEPLARLLREFLLIEDAAGKVRPSSHGYEFDFLGNDVDSLPDWPNQTGRTHDMTNTLTCHGQSAFAAHAEVLAPAAIPAPVPTKNQAWPAGVPEALASRYDHLELLGSGGCGVVYRARDLMLGRDVVLKFLKRDGDEIQRTYFLREVRLAGSLSHRNIVQILDTGSIEGRLYYVMQHVPGRTLGVALKNGALPPREALPILFDLATALDHAHSHGILHRDVKPENVLLGDDGVVRLFDFGLARLDSASLDQSLVVGTPSHMAPEQIRGGTIDHRTDLYSLGVVAYEVLTGRLPFETGNLFIAHALQPVPDPRMFRPELPVEVTALLERALAKQPEARFSSGAEFHAAAVHALREVPGPA